MMHPIILPIAYGATLNLELRWQAEGIEMPDSVIEPERVSWIVLPSQTVYAQRTRG